MNRQLKQLSSLIFISAFPLLTISSVQSEEVDWSYGGQENPTHWGELSPEFADCETGKYQSPINLEQIDQSIPASLKFNYQPTSLEIVRNVSNGQNVQVNYDKGSTLTVNSQEYELFQFHFHTPSEHTLKGEASGMELHLVHQNQAGEYAVVGVFIEEGEENPLLATIFNNLPAENGTKTDDVTLNASDFLPSERSYWSYSGSLTTPPCTEGVSWYVLDTPIEVSEEQMNQFAELYTVNARPVQPLNERQVEHSE